MPKHKKRMQVDVAELAITLLKSNLIGYALTLIFIIFASLLLTYTNLGPGFEKTIVMLGVMASAALVGFDTAKMEGKKGYKWGFVGGLSYLVVYLICSALLTKPFVLDMGTLMLLAVITMLSGAIAGMFAVASQK